MDQMTTSTYIGWAVVLAGGAYAYYKLDGKQRFSTSKAAPSREQEAAQQGRARERRRGEKGKTVIDKSPSATPQPEANSSGPGSGNDRMKKRGKGTKPVTQPSTTGPSNVPQIVEGEDDEETNKDWAQQLASMKKGIHLAPSARADTRNKTIKQSNANKTLEFSATSSTTGADADDDLSPALSPAIGATRSGGVDVGDMLEAPAAGPSVLRVTEPTQPARVRQPQQQRPAQTQETKKQRQNRRKTEEKKAQREEDEKARRVALEKQLRTAREARGEPARNGIQPAATPATNAWTAPAPAVNGSVTTAQPTIAADAPLLDTFDHDAVSTGSSSAAGTNGTSVTTAGTNWERELPSEEEQMRMINEETGWNTVLAGRKGKKKNNNAGNAAGDSTPYESSDTGATQPPGLKRDGVVSENVRLNGKVMRPYQPPVVINASHKDDSDWAVL